jgi:hypothetical protein
MNQKYMQLPIIVIAAILFTSSQAVAEIEPMILFSFHSESDVSVWDIENDTVMGGRSESALELTEAGTGLFSGTVSLDNNGGFASMQYPFPVRAIAGYTEAKIRLRGDGKRYLLLVESEERARHYYVGGFQTSGEWETITVALRDMEPVWRGDRLDQPNFAAESIAQIRIMIANQTRESFAVEIDAIWLE